MLERADQGIGQILQALKRRGLDRNTLVIYTQDNGGEWLSRNAPLFNRKGTVWEGGIRVPAIFRWPGRLPAGKVSSQVGIIQDVTASILAATADGLREREQWSHFSSTAALLGELVEDRARHRELHARVGRDVLGHLGPGHIHPVELHVAPPPELEPDHQLEVLQRRDLLEEPPDAGLDEGPGVGGGRQRSDANATVAA